MNNVRKLWENSNITALHPGLAASVRFDEPMSAHTTFRVGGPADLLASPSNAAELVAVIDLFTINDIPVSILGGGSNLLVSDKGIRGAVVTLDAFNASGRLHEAGSAPARAATVLPSGTAGDPSPSGILVRSGAGASMKELTEWCLTESLSGVERFAGLPGSVGGAVFMNARCYERSVSDVFFAAELLHFRSGGCTLETRAFDPADWDYKKSPFQRRTGADPLILADDTLLILAATFSLQPGEGPKIREEMDGWIRDRELKGHFRFPSAGSMFKNNHAFGKPSGKIIDEAGLRGFRIGDAQVAPWHGNIVINAGTARAADLRALVEEVRERVFKATGFALESEVIIAGDW